MFSIGVHSYSMDNLCKIALLIKEIPLFSFKIECADKLKQKPTESPLPSMPAEVLHTIALYIPDESLSHLADTCKMIKNKLNMQGPHVFMYADGENSYLPLKIIEECVLHNRNLLEECIYAHYKKLKNPAKFPDFLALFKNPLFDRNYISVSNAGADDIISSNALLYDLSYRTKNRFRKNWQNEHKIGDQSYYYVDRWIADSMLSLCCARAYDPASVRLLLNHKVPIKSLSVQINDNSIQTTPAIEATINSLVKKGFSSFNQCIAIMNLLIEHNADVHYISPYFGWNYLHRCAAHNATELLPYFIQKGVNPNHQDKKGGTPLFLVAKSMKDLYWWDVPARDIYDFDRKVNNACIAVYNLVQGGADPDIKNNKKKSMFCYIPGPLKTDVQRIIDNYKKEK